MKSSYSVSLDNELVELLERRGSVKSATINSILRMALKTEAGIIEEIDYHKKQIAVLEQELRDLREKETRKADNIPAGLKGKLSEIKNIIDKHPEKIYIWTDIVNEKYKQTFTSEELRSLITKWGDGKHG